MTETPTIVHCSRLRVGDTFRGLDEPEHPNTVRKITDCTDTTIRVYVTATYSRRPRDFWGTEVVRLSMGPIRVGDRLHWDDIPIGAQWESDRVFRKVSDTEVQRADGTSSPFAASSADLRTITKLPDTTTPDDTDDGEFEQRLSAAQSWDAADDTDTAAIPKPGEPGWYWNNEHVDILAVHEIDGETWCWTMQAEWDEPATDRAASLRHRNPNLVDVTIRYQIEGLVDADMHVAYMTEQVTDLNFGEVVPSVEISYPNRTETTTPKEPTE